VLKNAILPKVKKCDFAQMLKKSPCFPLLVPGKFKTPEDLFEDTSRNLFLTLAPGNSCFPGFRAVLHSNWNLSWK
jgi:hypothetical protein